MKYLIGFELKKMMQRKIVWITFLVFLVLQLAQTCMAYFTTSRYVDGQFLETKADWYKIDRKNAQALSGRKIDDSLLTELADSYKYKPNSYNESQSYEYLSSDNYQNKVRPYEEIDTLVKEMTGRQGTSDYNNVLDITQDKLYKTRKDGVEMIWVTEQLQ